MASRWLGHFGRWASPVLSALFTSAVVGSPIYNVIDLGYLPSGGGGDVTAHAINNARQIVGQALDASNNNRAFLWQNGVMQDLGTLSGGSWSVAYDISDNGFIVGRSSSSGGSTSFVKEPSGPMTQVPIDGVITVAQAVNSTGVVAGLATPASDQPFLAFRWTATGGTEYLGTLGGTSSDANRINAAGQIVGESKNVQGIDRAYIYSGGQMIDLGYLEPNGSSDAYDLNDSGWVVGRATVAAGGGHAFIWSNGVMQDMGTLGGVSSLARGINNHGQIVGSAMLSSGEWHPFLWDAGQITDLNPILAAEGITYNYAVDINDGGDILINGFYGASPDARAFLLTPVPEPSCGVVAMALALVTRYTRLKRSAKKPQGGALGDVLTGGSGTLTPQMYPSNAVLRRRFSLLLSA